jgi:hypothetical protein
VASDNNLTFYEAALLYGEEFKKTYLFSGDTTFNEIITFFKQNNIDWFYQTVTPWKDLLLSVGGRQNLLLFGWGDDQSILRSLFAGGTSLPRANTACTDDQLALAKLAISINGAINIMASHYSYVCYEANKPLLSNDLHNVDDINYNNIGSFYKNRDEIYGLFETKAPSKSEKIHYTICGHTHRCGAYVHESLYQALAVGANASDALAVLTQNHLGLSSVVLSNISRTVSLVCGTAGDYSQQNLERGLSPDKGPGHYDLEPSQGVSLIFNDQNQAQKAIFKRDTGDEGDLAVKPRLAVRLDYLWYEDNIPPFTNGQLKSDSKHPIAPNIKGDFYFFANPKWLNFLFPKGYSDRPDLPITSFSLYATHKLGTRKTERFGPMMVDPPPINVDQSQPSLKWNCFSLNAKGSDLRQFISDLKKLDQWDVNWLWFISASLKDINGLSDQYNVNSPWCWPVEVEPTSNTIQIKRTRELPNFDQLSSINEYKQS